MSLAGYAVLYGVRSAYPLRGFNAREVVLPGAFRESVRRGRTLRGKRITAVLNHDRTLRLGRVGRGLELAEDEQGISFRLACPLLPGFTGMSFRFRAIRWRRRGLLYELIEGDLTHISILTRPHEPAYPGTADTVREMYGEE